LLMVEMARSVPETHSHTGRVVGERTEGEEWRHCDGTRPKAHMQNGSRTREAREA